MVTDNTTAEPVNAQTFQTLVYRRSENGVVFIAIDVKDKSVNILTPELHQELGVAARMLAADESAIGAVIHSAKPTFMAGGDLNRIVQYFDRERTAEEAYVESRPYTESLRLLETCGKPVAVAINGTALGGGLELALACHYRVVSDEPKIRLGLPEVSLGLIPGGGGTQRLPRLIGIARAASLILSGERLTPSKALEIGIVDRVVPASELLDAAEQWVLTGPPPAQPWDSRSFRVPGGSGLNDMTIGALFQRLTASVSAQYRHNYPAPIAALKCLFNGTTVRSMDQALEIESREFSALTRTPVARNMIRTLFLNRANVDLDRLLSEDGAVEMKRRCLSAYVKQGTLMAAAGIGPALIENAAFSCGMPDGPLAMSESQPRRHSGSEQHHDMIMIRNRLMCAQSLAAAECWEDGIIDPAKADLVSHFGWGFPSYTGGVLSFIDTLGLRGFIELCDDLTSRHNAELTPSAWLRGRAEQGNRIFPPPGRENASASSAGRNT